LLPCSSASFSSSSQCSGVIMPWTHPAFLLAAYDLLVIVVVPLLMRQSRQTGRTALWRTLEAVETLILPHHFTDKMGLWLPTGPAYGVTITCLWLTRWRTAKQVFAHSSGIWASLFMIITLHNQVEFKPGQESLPITEKAVVVDASETILGKSQGSFCVLWWK
jgi:hypothetical protein